MPRKTTPPTTPPTMAPTLLVLEPLPLLPPLRPADDLVNPKDDVIEAGGREDSVPVVS